MKEKRVKKAKKVKCVWLVDNGGEYSDYSVVGICSTKKRAEMLADLCGGGEYSRCVLDPDVGRIRAAGPLWCVRMSRDGTVVNAWSKQFWRLLSEADVALPKKASAYVVTNASESAYLHVETRARDKAHAVKIANEHRVHLIAENKWPPDLSPKEE